jgi:hypothetical protein
MTEYQGKKNQFFEIHPIFKNPGFITLLALIGIILILISINIIAVDPLLIIILAPGIVLAYIENKYSNLNNKNITSQRFYLVPSQYRYTFMAGGYVLGFVWILLLILIIETANIYSLNNIQGFWISLCFTLGVLIGAIILVSGTYRIQQESPFIFKRFRLFSHPSQIILLYLYSLFFSFIVPFLMVVSYYSTRTLNLSLQPKIYEGSAINAATQGNFIFISILSISFIILISSISYYLPYFLNKSSFKFPTKPMLIPILTRLGGLIFGVFIFNFLIIISPSKIFLLIIYLFLALSFILTLATKIPQRIEYCTICNTVMKPIKELLDNNIEVPNNKSVFCPSCDVGEFNLKVNIDLPQKVLMPECPSCGEYWTEMSRRCKSCNYTIVLSCNYCYQTLNPLWKSCSICKTPIKAIPDLALELGDSPQYTFSLVTLRLLSVIIVLYLLFDLLFVYTFYSLLFQGRISENIIAISFNHIVRAIIFISVLLTILYLNFNYTKEYYKPIILINSKLIFIPILVLTVFVVIIIVLDSINNLLRGLSFIAIFYSMLAIFIMVLVLISINKSITEFIPIMKYNPVIMNQIVNEEVTNDG